MVTWFSGMFYIVRLFIYNAEANEKPEPNRSILQQQFAIMSKRLWYGITWPSAILTLIFGPYMWYLYGHTDNWLLVKLAFVLGLYFYHYTLHVIYRQQASGVFKYSSGKLRVWNEVATIFLISIIMLVVVKQSLSLIWGLGGLVVFVIVLMGSIKIYKAVRERS